MKTLYKTTTLSYFGVKKVVVAMVVTGEEIQTAVVCLTQLLVTLMLNFLTSSGDVVRWRAGSYLHLSISVVGGGGDYNYQLNLARVQKYRIVA